MKKYLLCLLLLTSGALTFADTLKSRRVLFLLDGSSSMSVPYTKGQTRFQKAAATILAIMDSISAKEKNVEFALRVYGYQYPAQEKNCFDTKMEVPFSRGNRSQMELRLDNIKPIGISPLAFSLRQISENDLAKEFQYSIVIISDGGESCGGNMCLEAESLKQKAGIVLSFVDLGISNIEMAALDCIKYQPIQNIDIAKLEQQLSKQAAANRLPKESIATSSEPDTGFGFLLFREVGAVKDVAVFYRDSNNVDVPLSKLELYNLHSGSQLRIKTGSYKIEYKADRPNAKRKGVIEATVKNGMITNVILQ